MPPRIATSATSSLSSSPREGSTRLTSAALVIDPTQAPSSKRSKVLSSRPIESRLAAASMAAMEAEAIRATLAEAFPDAAELSVEDRTGTGDHFQVTVASPAFDGLSLLDQHRRVNEALAEPLADGSIHELRIKTKGTA